MAKFGVIYTLGNIISLLGYLGVTRTSFLAGFTSQFKTMMKDTRLAATLFYFSGMILTLVAAFAIKNERLQRLLVILGVVIQFCAYFWYNLTFIPFGRRIFKAMCRKCCDSCMEEIK